MNFESILYKEIKITNKTSPTFILNDKTVDIWDNKYNYYHSKTPLDYISKHIIDSQKTKSDIFSQIIGKDKEKFLIKTALLSNSTILFTGEKGYGKTTFSKSIANLLPEKLLSIQDCKINDDPTYPICFSCKKKYLDNKEIYLTWIPRIWVRISGDPLLNTRQLIGGLSIQKILEGKDLDHPEVFLPGRVLKANRGICYFDELGAIPTSLQTLLHELFEEKQITSNEGDIIPFKLNSLTMASTNPSNYRGTNPIKEPLLDRMEEIPILPPDNLQEEIIISQNHMFSNSTFKSKLIIPPWHNEILIRIIQIARNKKFSISKKILTPPSCRGSIKLLDHISSNMILNSHNVTFFSDYGVNNQIVKLSLYGRIELEYATNELKNDIIDQLLIESIKLTCKEIYNKIHENLFDSFIKLIKTNLLNKKHHYIDISTQNIKKIQNIKLISQICNQISTIDIKNTELLASLLEIIIHSISICAPQIITYSNNQYFIKK